MDRFSNLSLPGIALIGGAVLVVVGVIVALFALPAYSGPEGTVAGFMNSVNEGKPDQVLNFVCGDFAAPPLPSKFLQNVNYETIDKNDQQAHIHVRGETRVQFIVSVKKEFDFIATVEKDLGRWCIRKESIADFLNSYTVVR